MKAGSGPPTIGAGIDDRPHGAIRRLALGAYQFARRQPIALAAIVMFLAFAVSAPVFPTLANAQNIVRQTAPVLLLGLGMTVVALVGGIDLSVGSVVLASATAAGVALIEGLPSIVAVLAAIATGAAVGAANAALIEALRVSPVIVTLGSMIAVRGLALMALGAHRSWITINAPAFTWLAEARVLGFPVDAAILLALSVLVWAALTKTVYGRRLYAIGDNERTARLCGVPVRAYRSAAYIACGAFAGLGGILFAARTSIVSPSIGVGLEFYAIAVVALGAGGLPPGRIKTGETVLGALVLMMVFNFMTIRGIPGAWQTTATGFLLLGAMLIGRVIQGRATDEAIVGFELISRAPFGRFSRTLSRNAVIAATVTLAIIFSAINPRFPTIANVVTLIDQNTALAIVAVGAMLGIVSRCIDISPGSVVALGAVAAALTYQSSSDMPFALVAGVGSCIIVYALNGLVVARLGLDPLIVTLAAWIWARGLAVSLTQARTIPFAFDFVGFMNAPLLAGFGPGPAMMVLAYFIGWIVLARLPLGMHIYALGADPRMLRQAGVADNIARLKVMALMGCFTAAGMIVMLGRLGAAAPTAGFGLELDAIVAVVIGGASFRGGEGRLRDTAVGVAFLAVLNNGLSGLQMGDAGFFLIKGTAILAALTLRAATRFLPEPKPA